MSDYERSQRRRNVTVGIFVILALCAFVGLIFKFGEMPGMVTKARAFNIFVQLGVAQGVQKDTPVRFCGYQVGRVTKVMPPELRLDEMRNKTYHQTVCVLSIDKKYKNIPSNATIKVMTRGLGSSYIEIKVDPEKEVTTKDPNRPETKYLTDKMWVQGSTGMTSEFFPEESQKKLDELVTGLRDMIGNVNKIVGDESNRENIKGIIANLADTTDLAAETLEKFNEFMVTSTEASEELSKSITEMRNIAQKINDGDGTVGMLVNDGRLYENLLENTEQLELLIRDVQNLVTEYRAKGIKVKL